MRIASLHNPAAVFRFFDERIAAGESLDEIEWKLEDMHQVDRDLVAEVLPLARTIYEARKLRETPYRLWYRDIRSDTPQSIVLLATPVIGPICFWITYQLALWCFSLPLHQQVLDLILTFIMLGSIFGSLVLAVLLGYPALIPFFRWRQRVWQRRASRVRELQVPLLSSGPRTAG